MADQNPTGDGVAVALTIPPGDLKFLRSTLMMARDGIREELAGFAGQLREPRRLRREDAAYGRLLCALDTRLIVPDYDIVSALGNLAKVIDQSNAYRRVVSEHAALHGLLGQIAHSPGGA